MIANQPITLLMPIRNGERFLIKSIEYLERNAETEDEILVINDNSTDDTGSILKRWTNRNSKVVVINNPKSGLVEALNFGLSQASNEWVARFDADDRYPFSRISETKKYINQDAIAIFSDYQFTSSTGIPLGYMPSAIGADNTYLSLVTSQRTAHPSVCFNKYSVLEVGGYQSKDYPAEDLSLWLRMSHIGKLKSLPINLLKYRLSGTSITGSSRNKALTKKSSLIKNFNFDLNIVRNCIDELDNSKRNYLNYNHGRERYLLHLRDLALILKSQTNRKSSELDYVKRKISLELKNYPPALELFGQMLLRKIYRLL